MRSLGIYDRRDRRSLGNRWDMRSLDILGS